MLLCTFLCTLIYSHFSLLCGALRVYLYLCQLLRFGEWNSVTYTPSVRGACRLLLVVVRGEEWTVVKWIGMKAKANENEHKLRSKVKREQNSRWWNRARTIKSVYEVLKSLQKNQNINFDNKQYYTEYICFVLKICRALKGIFFSTKQTRFEIGRS